MRIVGISLLALGFSSLLASVPTVGPQVETHVSDGGWSTTVTRN